MAMARVIMVDDSGLYRLITVHWLECNRLIMTASIRSMDAVAWIKKYLVAASVDRGL